MPATAVKGTDNRKKHKPHKHVLIMSCRAGENQGKIGANAPAYLLPVLKTGWTSLLPWRSLGCISWESKSTA
jgi:hypothetical protein